jgi:hypothetical protein
VTRLSAAIYLLAFLIDVPTAIRTNPEIVFQFLKIDRFLMQLLVLTG